MSSSPSDKSVATATSVYKETVWPALWKVLQLPAPPSPASSASAVIGDRENVRCAHALQKSVTRALARLFMRVDDEVSAHPSTSHVSSRIFQDVVAQLLVHAHRSAAPAVLGDGPERQTGVQGTTDAYSASSAAAVEVERLYLLICAAIQLSWQVDLPLLSAAKTMMPTGETCGTAESTLRPTAGRLPWGVELASKAVVAGIFGLSNYLHTPSDSHGTEPSSTAPGALPSPEAPSKQPQQAALQHLWFTFLLVYLQQLSAHTPKDTTAYARFFASCGEEARKRLSSIPALSDDEDSDDDGQGNSNGSRQLFWPSETAALRAWSQVPAELLRDTIARTRFRRAAILFKSFVPHMPTQAPAVTFLLVDLFTQFAQSWQNLMSGIPKGCLAKEVQEQLTHYSIKSVTHDCTTENMSAHGRRCSDIIRAYGDRLVMLLGFGVPHGQLVASALCAALSALYVVPNMRSAASAKDAITAHDSVPAPASGASRGKRGHEAAALELEAACRLPCRGTAPDSTSVDSPSIVEKDWDISEAEWRLRHYAPFGQLLAHVRILLLQKTHIFHVATRQLRVGRGGASQAEHARLLALTALHCGVAGWDLTLLIYHFAEFPLPPFEGPESPPPVLPGSVLAHYTAAVQHYVEHSRAELLMDMPFMELRERDGAFWNGNGDTSGRARAPRRGGGAYTTHFSARQQQTIGTPHPSRGELHTPRFLRMVSPDPLLLNWRVHVSAAEASLPNVTAIDPVPKAASTAIKSTPSPPSVSSGGSPNRSGAGMRVSLSPCLLIRDLLVEGLYALASEGIRHFAQPPKEQQQNHDGGADTPQSPFTSINVLLFPRRAYPQQVSVAYCVSLQLTRWLRRWIDLEQKRQLNLDEVYQLLLSFTPALVMVQSYLANQSLLTLLLARLGWMCRSAVQKALTNDGAEATHLLSSAPPCSMLALTEQLLVEFVMPCVRVLPPAPMVYDVMADVLETFQALRIPDERTGAVVPYGVSEAMPLHFREWLQALLPSQGFTDLYRTKVEQLQQQQLTGRGVAPLVYPHDAWLRKEREALLSQSLKRLNAENLDEYRALLRPILYAEPLLVAHRLFVQAIGYKNNFLEVHTRLLCGAPKAILMFIVQQGLLLMARYAAEEKVADTSGESRVATLATFLATLWRDNINGVDGTLLVRQVELALRCDSGSHILLGLELCKALFTVMVHRTLEHEEKYNPAQLQALAYTPSTTSLFGRGAMTSFRIRYWKDTASSALLLLSPTDVFVRARAALMAALQQTCVVLAKNEESGDEADGDGGGSGAMSLSTLGQMILVHLCRLQSRIHDLQRDLDGGAELILLSSGQRFNGIGDLLAALEELTPAPRSESLLNQLCDAVHHVALPHVSSLLEVRLRWKFDFAATGETTSPADAVYHVFPGAAMPAARLNAQSGRRYWSSAVAQRLQYFTAAHLEYDAAPYEAARCEWKQCYQRAHDVFATYSNKQDSMVGTASALSSRRRAAAILSWLNKAAKQIDVDEAMHRRLHATSAAARTDLWEMLCLEIAPDAASALPSSTVDTDASAIADDRLLDLAVSYLLPRAILNFREAATVAAFFTWSFTEAASPSIAMQKEHPVTPNSGEAPLSKQQRLQQRIIDLALTFLTAAFTFFVGFTDCECKRLGYVLQRLLQIPALSAQGQQLDTIARLSPGLLTHLPHLSSRVKPGTVAAQVVASVAANVSARQSQNKTTGRTSATVDIGDKAEVAQNAAVGVKGDLRPSDKGLRTVSQATFHGFLQPPKQRESDHVVGGDEAAYAASASLWTIAAARGLASSVAATAMSSAVAPVQPVPVRETAPDAAIPLQLESYLTRAVLQLLTHEQDIPSYVHRNVFLVLEQLDKLDFPSTLCAVDLLIRAVEPHASKTKSYYALASAVLKLLRANRRCRREAQYAVSALRREEEAGGDGIHILHLRPHGMGEEGEEEMRQQLQASAVACHARWRLAEHYMRQLLQDEAVLLFQDTQTQHRIVSDEEEEEEEDEKGAEEREEEKEEGEEEVVVVAQAVDGNASEEGSASDEENSRHSGLSGSDEPSQSASEVSSDRDSHESDATINDKGERGSVGGSENEEEDADENCASDSASMERGTPTSRKRCRET